MAGSAGSLLLRTGLSVEVIGNGTTAKTLYFSKPVRGVELNAEECSRLASILVTRDGGPRPMELIRQLLREGYMADPRDLKTIRTTLGSLGLFIKPSPLNVLLTKMVSRGEISRIGERRSYRYSDRSPSSRPRNE